jgi:hypothetical protein
VACGAFALTKDELLTLPADTMAGWMTVICQLVNENRRLKDHIMSMRDVPVRYCDRPPGFVEVRRSFCRRPYVCFDPDESAHVCGPCDTAAVKVLLSRKTPA